MKIFLLNLWELGGSGALLRGGLVESIRNKELHQDGGHDLLDLSEMRDLG